LRCQWEIENGIPNEMEVRQNAHLMATEQPFVWTKTADEILDKAARYAGETLRFHA
jgi:hypothetical protein